MNKHIAMLLFILLVFFLSPVSSGIDLLSQDEGDIEVEIKGEVVSEGVYTLPCYSTIEDLLELAGTLESADLSGINLTTTLKDHDVIVVPAVSETTLISINSATVEQLQELSGIGPTIAERIVEYRNYYGFFQSLEDIKNVKGIGDKIYEKIKDYICL